jgi:hypothetical protein
MQRFIDSDYVKEFLDDGIYVFGSETYNTIFFEVRGTSFLYLLLISLKCTYHNSVTYLNIFD